MDDEECSKMSNDEVQSKKKPFPSCLELQMKRNGMTFTFFSPRFFIICNDQDFWKSKALQTKWNNRTEQNWIPPLIIFWWFSINLAFNEISSLLPFHFFSISDIPSSGLFNSNTREKHGNHLQKHVKRRKEKCVGRTRSGEWKGAICDAL